MSKWKSTDEWDEDGLLQIYLVDPADYIFSDWRIAVYRCDNDSYLLPQECRRMGERLIAAADECDRRNKESKA